MSFWAYKPYVPVAQRRKQAAARLAGMKKGGEAPEPVVIEGRTIAASFWGKSWCSNLERYSDYQSRLPRGRSYVRNGSVLDLRITEGRIAAKVMGSELYRIEIGIKPVAGARWKEICKDCVGSIDSVVELLQGRLAKSVMDRVCRQGDGLFPAPRDIDLSCSCPDWADMCKHVAAVMYGIGARLDDRPELLFLLRGVDQMDLIGRAGTGAALAGGAGAGTGKGGGKALADHDLAALFGLDMAADAPAAPRPAAPKPKSGAPAAKFPARVGATTRPAKPAHPKPAPSKSAPPTIASGSKPKVKARASEPAQPAPRLRTKRPRAAASERSTATPTPPKRGTRPSARGKPAAGRGKSSVKARR